MMRMMGWGMMILCDLDCLGREYLMDAFTTTGFVECTYSPGQQALSILSRQRLPSTIEQYGLSKQRNNTLYLAGAGNRDNKREIHSTQPFSLSKY